MANMRKRSQRLVTQAGATVMTLCLAGRHLPEDHWVMRPPLVGAGIVVPKVHFDRGCRRCRGTSQRVWADVEGTTGPLSETMTLSAWLTHHGATVKAPKGEIRVPDQAEIEALLTRVS